jgi:hypothetical protein
MEEDKGTPPRRTFEWLEDDGAMTRMFRLGGGGAQCVSNGDDGPCYFRLLGDVSAEGDTPEALVAEDFNGEHPVSLLWASGRRSNIGHLNGVFLRYLLRRKDVEIRWRATNGSETRRYLIARRSEALA